MDKFSYADGGTVCQYELARTLKSLGQNVKIYILSKIHIQNSIFNDFYTDSTTDFKPSNTVVIYCEGIIGNPLNAKYIVRWMLSELGQNVPYDNLNSWDKNELVYYFNSEPKFEKNPEKIGSVYKLLTCIYMDPNIKQINFNPRSGACFTLRKAFKIHKSAIKRLHTEDSFEITCQHTLQECINIFNTAKYFVSYDPLTFYTIIAALCGCISVVHPINGVSKEEWLTRTCVREYMKHTGKTQLYGVAYGTDADEIEFATSTIHLVKDQWDDIIQFCTTHTILPFINDINNMDGLTNTIENNFFSS